MEREETEGGGEERVLRGGKGGVTNSNFSGILGGLPVV